MLSRLNWHVSCKLMGVAIVMFYLFFKFDINLFKSNGWTCQYVAKYCFITLKEMKNILPPPLPLVAGQLPSYFPQFNVVSFVQTMVFWV